MQKFYTKDLFQLQVELVEGKVDMAVSQAINRVIDRIDVLEGKMNTRFSALENRVVSVEHRLVAVETKLGMVAENKKTIRAKLIEYSFQASWIGLCILVSYLIVHLHWAN